MTRLGLFSNLVDSSVAYKRAHRELYKMQKGIFHTNNIIHTSFYNIFKAEQCVFDPMLLTGESFCDNSIQKKLVPLSRKNLAEYLQRVKQERGLSLNEFAKELYVGSLNKATKIDKHLKIIADLSSKVNAFGNNEWHRVNLSGLDFSNTDLSETIFSGSDLCKCNFTGANLSNANFESALIQEAIFCNTILRKSNFYCTDISKSRFTDSKLMYARFDWSVAVSASFKSVNLEFLQAPNSNWQNIKIENSQMSYGDFTKTNFQGAEFQKVTFKHSIFNKTLFDKANFINCDLSESLFNEAVLKHVIWDRCMAQNIEMRHANLTGGKISEYCNFEKADFSYAILDGIKAPRAHFAGAIMEHVKIGYGKLAASCLDGASLKFSDLNSCVLSESSCIGTDFTGAKLFNIKMVRSSLKSSVLVGAIIQDSSFNKTNCEDSNWQSAKFIEVILDHVNNHRIKINDNTEFVNCSLKELNGQFYHYDEDAFMDIMFVEQLEMNIAKIDRAELLRKIGIFSFVLRLVSAEYKAISRKEVKRLHNIKLHNSKELKQYLKKLNDQERAGRDLNKLKVMNLLMQASH